MKKYNAMQESQKNLIKENESLKELIDELRRKLKDAEDENSKLQREIQFLKEN